MSRERHTKCRSIKLAEPLDARVQVVADRLGVTWSEAARLMLAYSVTMPEGAFTRWAGEQLTGRRPYTPPKRSQDPALRTHT